jgi:hypothetical protein
MIDPVNPAAFTATTFRGENVGIGLTNCPYFRLNVAPRIRPLVIVS